MIILSQTRIKLLDRCEEIFSCANFGNHEQNHDFFQRHDFLVAPLFTFSVLALPKYLFNDFLTKTQNNVLNFGKWILIKPYDISLDLFRNTYII